jgi:hypothetical protein
VPTTTTAFVLALLATVVVGFVALWVAICYLLASVSGWKRLQHLYATGPFEGPTFRTSGYIGRSRYRGALIAGASAAGLYLNVAPLFRIAAGPLLIPWKSIEGPSPSPGLASHLTLEIPAANASLRLPESVASRLLHFRPINLSNSRSTS